jgi:TRAP-type C4-dicarboxylate transport system permease small subunit
MSELDFSVPSGQARQPPPRGFDRFCRLVALFGGILCLIVATTSVISVLGRSAVTAYPEFGKTALGNIVKDIVLANTEFVKMATAVAIFAFLPYSQIQRSNIVVDTFTGWMPKRLTQFVDAFWDIVYALVMGACAYALIFGTESAIKSGETTQQLAVPLWPSIAMSTALCWMLALVCIATAVRLVRKKADGGQS